MKRSVKQPKAQQKEITKSDYWLNINLPTGQIGINLAHGIEQHDTVLDLINKVGLEKLNKFYESKNSDCYVVQVGHSNRESKVDDLANEILAMS